MSDWSSLKRGKSYAHTLSSDRVTNYNKLELFSRRGALVRPSSVSDETLSNLSFYAFWRLFSVTSNKLRKRRQEKMVVLNGCGWPRQAKRTHAQHTEYAKRTLYAYAPCAGLQGTEYLDAAVARFFKNDWAAALRAFVEDEGNHWCPTWIRRNYEIEH